MAAEVKKTQSKSGTPGDYFKFKNEAKEALAKAEQVKTAETQRLLASAAEIVQALADLDLKYKFVRADRKPRSPNKPKVTEVNSEPTHQDQPPTSFTFHEVQPISGSVIADDPSSIITTTNAIFSTPAEGETSDAAV